MPSIANKLVEVIVPRTRTQNASNIRSHLKRTILITLQPVFIVQLMEDDVQRQTPPSRPRGRSCRCRGQPDVDQNQPPTRIVQTQREFAMLWRQSD